MLVWEGGINFSFTGEENVKGILNDFLNWFKFVSDRIFKCSNGKFFECLDFAVLFCFKFCLDFSSNRSSTLKSGIGTKTFSRKYHSIRIYATLFGSLSDML